MIQFTGTPQAWNECIASLPLPHLLQTWEWSQVKARYGWEQLPFVWNHPLSPASAAPVAAALVLKRSVAVAGFAKKMCVLYIPKGPNLDWNDVNLRKRVLGDLQSLARQQGAIFVKLDPDVLLGTGIPETPDSIESSDGQALGAELVLSGWKFSKDQIQFRNTVLVDLTVSEEQMLTRMKQKTRYNIRLAQKKGVSVRVGTDADFPLLYKMYAETSVRDGFLIRGED